jgi:cell division protein ZipA
VESLRWILLAAGAAFIIVIYLLGRSRRRRNHSMVDDMDAELPEFTARSLDDVDEGVGAVRIISSGAPEISDEDLSSLSAGDETLEQAASEEENISDPEQAAPSLPNDIVVLYILAKPNKQLVGSQVNSSAQAMGLSFGEMNIFHYRKDGRNVFSLANMLEPGSFDASTIHDLKTTGLTVFMQIQGDDPLDDLTEMLQRSYQLAGLLDARLCNHRREPLTEQDAENYRTQVANFTNNITHEVSSET